MKKRSVSFIILGVVIFLILILIFLNLNNDSKNTEIINEKSNTLNPIILNTELTDVSTGGMFTISDLGGKPILLESFAVWCPTCTRQQQEIKKLHDEIGDSVVSISLDTDPNEDESRILQHLEENGFDWRYAVSPIDLSQALIDEFGVSIVNAPSAPVILICNGEARKLDSGVKTASRLKEEINTCNG